MKRRNFIKNTAASASLLTVAGLSLHGCTNVKKHITILHTNDVHSHIDPFPKDHANFPNQGGLARRASLVANVRNENPNTFLFDAGDIFQGTPYFNFYGGELEFKLMSMLQYDATTIGNHDFDNGVHGLLAQMPHGKFDFICANYDFSNTVLNGYTKPYKIYEKDGVKVGVYGLGIALEGLVTKQLYKETKYLNPYEIAHDLEYTLKVEKECDLVICLSHLGYKYENLNKPSDVLLAAKTRHTNLIIGGHTHTFLKTPTKIINTLGNEVLVNQVGCFGVHVGRVDFYLDLGTIRNKAQVLTV